MLFGPIVNPDGTKRNISRVLAFKLGADGRLPPPPVRPELPAPPEQFGSDAQIQAGAALFMRTCAGCHGVGAISGGVLQDLRHSAMLADAEAWRGIVIEGALQDLGMVSFAQVLSAEDAESIRAFVVHQANVTAQ